MKRMLLIILALYCTVLIAENVNLNSATQFAIFKLSELYPQHSIIGQSYLSNGDNELCAYVFNLSPTGYMVVGASTDVPPLIAYSGTSDFYSSSEDNVLADIILTDINNRKCCSEEVAKNNAAWHNAYRRTAFEQWPPVGYSNTEGWIKTNWTQYQPYNMFVPLDMPSGQRSVAGCPAIAMGMIVDYHKTFNGTRLNDTDDYYHNYGGDSYWVDDAYETYGFLSYPQTNEYLDAASYNYRYGIGITNEQKGAIVFALGSALKQVYSADGSGTFSVNQAYNAYRRFAFNEATLLTETSPDLYVRMEQNVKAALPVHLAVVTPAWDMGHNLVVDGYNTNGYYHVNFGHGGSSNGWIMLPEQVPYGMTVVEGAIVDIKPAEYVFTVPDVMDFTQESSITMEVLNMHNGSITLEAILPGAGINIDEWQITPSQPLPCTIPQNQMITINFSCPGGITRDVLESYFRLVLDHNVFDVPVSFTTASVIDDDYMLPVEIKSSVYPNPFSGECRVLVNNPKSQSLEFEVYNLRGQKLLSKAVTSPSSTTEILWNGLDVSGKAQPAGIYLYRIHGLGFSSTGRMLKLN